MTRDMPRAARVVKGTPSPHTVLSAICKPSRASLSAATSRGFTARSGVPNAFNTCSCQRPVNFKQKLKNICRKKIKKMTRLKKKVLPNTGKYIYVYFVEKIQDKMVRF